MLSNILNENLNQLFTQLIFLGFAVTLIGAALMTIISRNPVRSALFLVLAFFASSGLWILLEVEFLGLILVLVYVGAVMTLFLFVIMTLNIDVESARPKFAYYLPYGLVIVVLLVGLMIYAMKPEHWSQMVVSAAQPENYSNVKALGNVLYTDYAYPFEIAGVLLLVGIIAAISLTARPRRGSKGPGPAQQINIQRADRIQIVKMPTEKK